MDFGFSKEEQLLGNSVREYIRDKVIPVADAEDRDGPLSVETTRKWLTSLEPFGYVGSLVPETLEGPGLSHVEAGIIFQELARAWPSLAVIALSTSNLMSWLSEAESESVSTRLLPGLLAGEITGAVAVTEPAAGTDTTAIASTAREEGEHCVVNGRKTWVANGGVADVVLVAVQLDPPPEDEQALGYVLVERDGAAFQAEEIPKLGLKGLSTAELLLGECRVPRENLVSPHPRGPSPRPHLHEPQACLTAAIAVGIMQAALDRSISYAKTRIQFGKALGQFQMIQQMISEMATGLDASTLLCFRALQRLDDGIGASREIAMAKSFATRTAVDVSSKAIQIHGAYGYSDEYPLERLYRDACALSMLGGNPDLHHLRVAEAITGLSALV
jgi:alkylation response protein AidB-like acyl-CoA dehydrogenase